MAAGRPGLGLVVGLLRVWVGSGDKTKGRLRRGGGIRRDSNAARMVIWALAGDHLKQSPHAYSALVKRCGSSASDSIRQPSGGRDPSAGPSGCSKRRAGSCPCASLPHRATAGAVVGGSLTARQG
jgi:hypothetical protein